MEKSQHKVKEYTLCVKRNSFDYFFLFCIHTLYILYYKILMKPIIKLLFILICIFGLLVEVTTSLVYANNIQKEFIIANYELKRIDTS